MKERDSNLDLIRGGASLMVLAGHLRAFLIDPATANLFNKMLVFAFSFGHQAVMIFFVLSGYFIGRSVHQTIQVKKWHWGKYLVNRLSRLWVVLVPSLLLTFVFDYLGMQKDILGYYQGKLFYSYYSGNYGAIFLDWKTLISNFLFLQGKLSNMYGTNTPLWSLSIEFWYYMIFPLLMCSLLVTKNIWQRIFHLFLALLLIIWLPKVWMLWGIIWLAGYAVFLAQSQPNLTRFATSWWFVSVSSILFISALLASALANIPALLADFLVGISFALTMLWIPLFPLRQPQLAQIGNFLGEISYTQYLFHFPFLGFVFTVFFKNQRFAPSWSSWGIFFLLLGLTIFLSWGLYWLAEKRTPWVRNHLLKLFSF